MVARLTVLLTCLLAAVDCFVVDSSALWRPRASRAHASLRRPAQPEMIQPLPDGSGAFKDMQEYPCTLDVKIIADNEGPLVADLRTLAAEATGLSEDAIPTKFRDKGKYRSVTLTLRFENSEQVREANSRTTKP